MKKMMMTLIAMLTIAATGKAMSYEQARNEALFLTDKMAYELNLTEEQYEAAYEINLDYLMGVTSYDDVYGTYWERRNLDLSYILLDWQLSAFRAATYFYRPLYWADGYWHFGIYARYPHRDYFYYGRPVFYASYRGAHAWHVTGHSWYHGRRDHYIHHSTRHFGMRDGWNRGDYRHHHNNGVRHSSTRTTVNHRDMNRHHDNMNRGNHNNNENRPNRTITRTENQAPRSLGGYRSDSRPRTIGGNASRPNSGSATPHSSNGTMRSNAGSFGGSSNRSSNASSFSRGSSHSSGGGRSTGGGHSYGGRR